MTDEEEKRKIKWECFTRCTTIANQFANLQSNLDTKETIQNLAVCFMELAESEGRTA